MKSTPESECLDHFVGVEASMSRARFGSLLQWCHTKETDYDERHVSDTWPGATFS